MTDLIRTLVLGVVEGITEFLPVSSTGHMLLFEHAMGTKTLQPNWFWNMFTVFIQIGAIFAVVVYFRERIMNLLRGGEPRMRGESGMTPLEIAQRAPVTPSARAEASAATSVAELPAAKSRGTSISPLLLIVIATIPVLIVGYLTHKWVEEHVEDSPLFIGLALGIGGVIMIVIEMFRPPVTTHKIEQMTLGQALGIGCCQILAAVFPGTSRSASTIMPGMLMGMSRESAAEFSFFLAIPAMFAACGYSLLKEMRQHGLDAQQWMLLIIGTLLAFLVAWVVIAAFMNFIRRNSFVGFGVYRIILSIVVLVWMVWLNK